MGWIWASSDKSQDNTPDHSPDRPHGQSPPAPSAKPSSFPAPPEDQSRPPPTRDELAEAEFYNCIHELVCDECSPSDELFANSPFPPSNLFAARPAATTSSDEKPSSSYAPAEVPPERKITPADLYPTSMSCRAAFDAAFYCQSLGGMFNSVYHYGSMRDCSPLWSNFWFCVKTNRSRMSEEERQGKVLDHYQKREAKYRVGPSSEDVWVQRATMLVGAFEGDLEAVLAEERRRREDID